MKSSARNEFRGTVATIKRGAVNDEIDIDLPGGDRIVAVITRESTDELGLRQGGEAIALIKASWVIVTTDDSDIRLSARNRLAGTVKAVSRGAVNSEVTIGLQGGNSIVAVITNESADDLGLKQGAAAAALFKASHVIVGTRR